VANAYATFAAQGIKSKPFLVSQVLGSNKGVLYEATPQTQEVFSKEVMADLTYALKGTITGGTGAAALALGRPVAGKTGTSQSNASAWFSAYTPQIAASVAFFRDSKASDGVAEGPFFIQGFSQGRIPFLPIHQFLGAVGPLIHPNPTNVLVIGVGSGRHPLGCGYQARKPNPRH